MTIYYVYAYLREDLTPYYIGKGKNDRAYVKDHNCPVPKDRSRIIILAKNLAEQTALDLETELIKHYGRKNLGTGILHNRTDGGSSPVLYGEHNGMTGKKHKKETLVKIRNGKLGKARTNSKCIVCPECNISFGVQGFVKHCEAKHPLSNYLDSYQPYKCIYCDAGLASKSSVRTHINRTHIGCAFDYVLRNPAVTLLESSV